MAESRFTEILTASSEHLLKVLYQAASQPGEPGADAGRRSEMTAKALGIRHGQLICAIGFNQHIDTLPDVLGLLGFASAADIYRLRDRIFTQDIYRHLRLREILAIYHQMALDHPPQAAMQELVAVRLDHLEGYIEKSVSTHCIERYRAELRAVYAEPAVSVEFAEKRLAREDSGFRAIANEIFLIAESRLIPIGDLFFRDSVHPEEKRRLIARGLVPKDLVTSRLDEAIPESEREALEAALTDLT